MNNLVPAGEPKDDGFSGKRNLGEATRGVNAANPIATGAAAATASSFKRSAVAPARKQAGTEGPAAGTAAPIS